MGPIPLPPPQGEEPAFPTVSQLGVTLPEAENVVLGEHGASYPTISQLGVAFWEAEEAVLGEQEGSYPTVSQLGVAFWEAEEVVLGDWPQLVHVTAPACEHFAGMCQAAAEVRAQRQAMHQAVVDMVNQHTMQQQEAASAGQEAEGASEAQPTSGILARLCWWR